MSHYVVCGRPRPLPPPPRPADRGPPPSLCTASCGHDLHPAESMGRVWIYNLDSKVFTMVTQPYLKSLQDIMSKQQLHKVCMFSLEYSLKFLAK